MQFDPITNSNTQDTPAGTDTTNTNSSNPGSTTSANSGGFFARLRAKAGASNAAELNIPSAPTTTAEPVEAITTNPAEPSSDEATASPAPSPLTGEGWGGGDVSQTTDAPEEEDDWRRDNIDTMSPNDGTPPQPSPLQGEGVGTPASTDYELQTTNSSSDQFHEAISDQSTLADIPDLNTSEKVPRPDPLLPQEREPHTQASDSSTNYNLKTTNSHPGIADSHDLDKKLSEVRDIEEEALTEKIADNWGIPYVDLAGQSIESDALAVVPIQVAQKARATGFRINNKSLSLAIENPNNVDMRALVKSLERDGYTVTMYMVSPRSIRKLIERYADMHMTTKSHGGIIDMNVERVKLISERVHKNSDIGSIISELLARPREQGVTSELIEIIMGSAIATKSSDIHIESQEDGTRLRMRQDGVLEDIYQLPADIAKSLASRIKILSGMKLTIVKDAQDGRFTVTLPDVEIEIRVSTIPGPYGEGIVMRILDPRGLTVSFEQLGIEPELMKVFEIEIAKPEGIILTTGPTGSGKTTTLYSFLQRIYNPEIKIITIEDPIEYHLKGIQQTQVNHEKGYDFLSGLRAAMRQDPEVVMVGEIRDSETAITAVQAAQTGHLVLSTLHTNSAAGVIPRLLVLGVNPALLASTLRMAIAQRLVRRLIPETKIARTANEHESGIIRGILQTAIAHGKNLSRFGFTGNESSYTVYDPAPTETSSGYKGRVGIYEAIIMDRTIEELLEKNPSEREVRIAARNQGILTMQEIAIMKILQGITSFEEVSEVIDLEADIDPSAVSASIISQTSAQVSIQHGSADAVTFREPIPNFHMDIEDVESLWNYLKILRAEHESSPNDTTAEQIRDAESIIMDIMKRNHGIAPTTASTSSIIERESKSLESELAELREHARTHPDPVLAKKLQQMHEILGS